ncbi:hypothetical protein V6N13_022833 [Hibiscus sabdariffa]
MASLPHALFVTPADPRLPKCQRQRNEDPPDASIPNGGDPVSTMECDATTIGRSIISYKYIVTAGGDSPQDPKISLQDGDNPGLSKKSATGDQSRQGQEAMVD